MSCVVGRRRGSDPTLLWLWHRLAATAPIRPVVWELTYALGVALKRQKKKNYKLTASGGKRVFNKHLITSSKNKKQTNKNSLIVEEDLEGLGKGRWSKQC